MSSYVLYIFSCKKPTLWRYDLRMTLRKCNPVWVCSQVTFAKWMHLCNQHWGWERARLSPKTTRGSPATFSYSSRIWWLSLPVPAFSRMSCKWGQSVWTRWSGFFYAASRVWAPSRLQWGFPGGSDGKASACSAGDPGSTPGSGRSPGEGNSNPLQYSRLKNSMDRGAWWATAHGVAKSRTRLSDFTY